MVGAILLCGIAVTFVLSKVPVYCSDAEVETIGLKTYRGLPWPCYVAPGISAMEGFRMWWERFPVNAMFWSVVVAFVSCIPGRRIIWKRVVSVMLASLVLGIALYVL